MKRIFRILMIAICCMVSFNMVANADNDKPISVKALPAKAQILLNNHFNGQKVSLQRLNWELSAETMMWFCRMARSWNSTKKEILQR